MKKRLVRRTIGWLRARLPDARLDRVQDPRRRHGRRWRLGALLQVVLVGVVAGCRSLAELEALTAEMSPATRRALGARGRLPDTTGRDVLICLDPQELRRALRRQVRSAHRRHALEPTRLPWGVVSMDGKATAIRSWDDCYAQRQGSRGIVRTITSTLVSSDARVCLDAHPIPPDTNEMGAYPAALEQLVKTYASLDLFRVVMYDAGACSEANARFTRNLGVHYVMVLNEAQPTLFAEACATVGHDSDDAAVVVDDHAQGVRYRLWLTEELAGFLDWRHLCTVVRLRREVLDRRGNIKSAGERYFVSSLRRAALSERQWVALLKARWGVENNCHHTFDSVFAEDDRPWIQASPVGALNVILLRRIAYNLMALFRSRTLRGEFTRLTPWRTLIRWTYNALIAATDASIAGLRPRKPPD
jgi:hypothetical protein